MMPIFVRGDDVRKKSKKLGTHCGQDAKSFAIGAIL